MLGIFDSHAHYEDKRFDEDREKLLSSMSSKNVSYIINVGSSIKTSKKTVELVRQYSYMYGSVGVHPEECGDMSDADLEVIKDLATKDKIVAIGEIGLDYYWPEPEHDIQKKWFHRQMELAVSLKLPVIIHSRDAAKDTMDIIKEYSHGLVDGRKGIIHCYSGSPEMAKEYVNMGFCIGVGGVLTFKNAAKLKKVVEEIDINSIVIETDCPYMAPVPFRGKRNDSSLLKYVVEEMAEIKGLSIEEVVNVTCQNALKVYGIEV